MFGYVIGSNDQKQQDELVRAIGWNIFYGMRFLTIIYVADTTSKQVSLMKIICNNYRYLYNTALYYTWYGRRCKCYNEKYNT